MIGFALSWGHRRITRRPPTTPRRCATSGVRTWLSAGQRSRGWRVSLRLRQGRGPVPPRRHLSLHPRQRQRTGRTLGLGPTAVVDHDLPAARATFAFFLRRCYAEGAGKMSCRPPRRRTGPRERARLPGPDVAAGRSRASFGPGNSRGHRLTWPARLPRRLGLGEYRSRRSKRLPPQRITVRPRRYWYTRTQLTSSVAGNGVDEFGGPG